MLKLRLILDKLAYSNPSVTFPPVPRLPRWIVSPFSANRWCSSFQEPACRKSSIACSRTCTKKGCCLRLTCSASRRFSVCPYFRSEERRVGKEGRDQCAWD